MRENKSQGQHDCALEYQLTRHQVISPSYVRFCQERICEALCRKKRNYLNEPSYYLMYKTFKIEDQRELTEYLETKIERKPDGTLE
jgi:hypothetical protein